MFTNSTDAYQSALKIMGHDYANKYANYWSKKNKTIKSGKANFKDSGKQKTYNAEFGAIRESIVSCIQTIKKFKKLNWKQYRKTISRRLQSLRLIRSCVRIKLVQMVDTKSNTSEKTFVMQLLVNDLVWCNAIKRNQLSIYNHS